MPLSDKDLAVLCQNLYDGGSLFDKVMHTEGVDYAIKAYDDCTVICFEGSHDIPDWERDVTFEMIQTPVGGVEKGFYEGMPIVLSTATALIDPLKPIYVIGHSLGAARAHIFAALLFDAGFNPKKITRTVWGSPNPGNETLAFTLNDSPCNSYRNFYTSLEQDFVCLVPEPIIGMPFCRASADIMIDEAPPNPDPWFLLARHHFYLYQRSMK